ncbi:alpha/beta fold hydrolase [Sulfitobacter sp.]|uniref:alpha/beta fold hydrolase n=1 Tax=Sulfitobacter sp. TaxID=1903071 RepID=UPI003F6B3C69|tara:strand:+ start:303 stop:1013 length:711 start_codon:yes stop_codon:yes gene_type:complete
MAEPLVLLPGLMCDARVFWPQIAELSATTAVTIAPVTQGERIEEIASGLLDQLPKRFALAGLGMGGAVALELLRRAPDRIIRIALIDTSPLAETPQAAAARELLIVKARSGRMSDVMQHEVMPHYLPSGPDKGAIMDLVMDMAETLGPEIYVRQARALQRGKDQQAVLRKCKIPALVMCGEFDKINPVKRHSFMAELIPHARLTVINGAGHLPTLERPRQTTAALQDWMGMPFVLQ